jgi:YD repeat-containing protein
MKHFIPGLFLPFTVFLLIFTFTPASALTINYEYDSAGRILTVEHVGVGSLNYRYDASGNITNITILVSGSTIIDSDQDGIGDAWERLYFNDLAVLSALNDYDKDGYSDLWEYLNWKDALVDSKGSSFTPTLANAAGARGYLIGVTSKGFWNLVLPAILHNKK